MQPEAVPNEDWNRQVRHETPVQRLDRNWSSLLQELRVVQTGVQLLTGFLLTLPFQSRFDALTDFQRGVYLVTVLASIAATILLVAPVGMHRLLFRQRRLPELVNTAHRFAMAGLLLLGVAMTGVVVLVVGLVVNTAAGIAAGVVTVVLFLTLWVAYPWRYRRR
ncbi:DUF6328 family protein [Rhodococcus aetherivorans]|uniref:DUF6328 family protein n=1 Tax=unclassified Rhodococcus (in: high G+C Gram-positive bacteria) TaxID=192944 RepID=UPI000927CFAA|nr:DUF6328 family protein [Rhodococcus sp. M8]NCL73128.1 hypothetical protein [Rhodococcus sp. YH1]OLL17098.1 sodium:proton antiporter [Rhodococcus sp. M8]QPG47169.1 sodium:proton antiporter [Rhodococcus sp. M8]